MSDRLIVRCAVYDGESLVDVVEQTIPKKEIRNALRRVHFSWRATEALENGRRVVFDSRKEKP